MSASVPLSPPLVVIPMVRGLVGIAIGAFL
jgi:hypothetical protein